MNASHKSNSCSNPETVKLSYLLAAKPCYGVLKPGNEAADDGVPLIRIGDITFDGRILHTNLLQISRALSLEYSRTILQPGDLVLSVVGTIGRAAEITTRELGFNLSRAVARIQCGARVSTSYLRYYFSSPEFERFVDLTCVGTAQRVLNMEDLSAIRLPLPTISEQRTIAAFLDHETARIDRLIEKQERLIELLKEKRQAVISQAVTKGLNPDAPMKDSGVEWLGEVPAHWFVTKLGYRYEVVLGKMLDAKRITGEFLAPYLRNTDVQWNSINTDNLPLMDFSAADRAKYKLKVGDLLVCEGGEVGRAAIWYHEIECFYQKALHRVRPLNKKKALPEFLLLCLSHAVDQERFTSSEEKATIHHLPAEKLRQQRFCFPPLEEQQETSRHVRGILNSMDRIDCKSRNAIKLLKERRAALISAAVTGKIDVRNWKPADDATKEATTA